MPKKKKYLNLITPVGTAAWPYLHVPDDYDKYSIVCRWPAAEVEHIDKALHELFDEEWPTMQADAVSEKQTLVKDEAFPVRVVRDDEGNDVGLREIRAKKNTSVKRGDAIVPLRVLVMDSTESPMDPGLVGAGSQIQLGLAASTYVRPSSERKDKKGKPLQIAGVRVTLDIVKVVQLTEPGGADPTRYAFGKTEGGYVHQENEGTEEPTGTAVEGAASGSKGDY